MPKRKSTELKIENRRPDRDRRVRQSDRMARVLRILTLIQSRGRWNAKAISEEVGCSERTIYRDLEVLQFSGVPWFYDEQAQCYRVRSDFTFPTLNLTADEAVGQAFASKLTRSANLDVLPGAKAVTDKLAVRANDQIAEVLEDAGRLIETFGLQLVDHSRHAEIIKTIQRALFDRKQLAGQYESPYEGSSKVTIVPYRLCFVKRAWYLIGQPSGESTLRTLRVARFKSLRCTDQHADVPERFDLKAYFGNAWSVFRGSNSFDVELVFSSRIAVIVAETTWHHTQKVKKNPDGSAKVTFSVDGLEEILHWILSWTGNVTIIAPTELRKLYQQTLLDGMRINEGTRG